MSMYNLGVSYSRGNTVGVLTSYQLQKLGVVTSCRLQRRGVVIYHQLQTLGAFYRVHVY